MRLLPSLIAAMLCAACIGSEVRPDDPVDPVDPDPEVEPLSEDACEAAYLHGLKQRCSFATPGFTDTCRRYESLPNLGYNPECMVLKSTCEAMTACRD